ncbi:MAG: hypothetical protein JKY48_15060 [Flavobacteriales bacterium]|nr:hypothetical protein [Flavobacteriales bacterium]
MADTFAKNMAVVDKSLLNALGETVSIGVKGPLVGVFEDETIFELDMQGVQHVFYYREADMPVFIGESLTYGATVYTVRNVETDGLGVGKLVLSEND